LSWKKHQAIERSSIERNIFTNGMSQQGIDWLEQIVDNKQGNYCFPSIPQLITKL